MIEKKDKKTKIAKERPQLLESLAWIVGAILAFVAASFLSSGLIWLLGKMGLTLYANGTVEVLIERIVVYVIMVALMLGVTWWLGKKLTWREMGLWRLPDWRDIGLGIVGILGYLILTTTLLSIAQNIPGFDVDQAQDTGLGMLFSLDLLMAFLVLVVATPFFEEWIFRGILYGGLRRARMPWWGATLLVSVLFGVAHMQWNVGIDVFALSVVMCILRERTNSIWAGFLLHAAKNFVAFYVTFVAVQGF